MGIVPSSYKEANVSPVPKKGDLTLVTNYRPISLLNSEAKVFELLIFKRLYSHIRHNNLLFHYSLFLSLVIQLSINLLSFTILFAKP